MRPPSDHELDLAARKAVANLERILISLPTSDPAWTDGRQSRLSRWYSSLGAGDRSAVSWKSNTSGEEPTARPEDL